ncbi:energy-coupled thiamine transporter ThiT [Streptococcus uberis]|uniref:energy-coupled thiamine transporter ThiT n=1 Tax=Streptococcus uberis TaxID=1349 RepID=UPI0012B539D2|nr:energy-coupled thiamine transporter ThiT [Streptococcus uberis]MTB57369.1 energy-coupled thiamine transporter ThiT [Streptococcus uberis]
MSQFNLRALTEMAIMTALALVLDKLVLFTMPQGGSVSLVMLPIFIVAIRWGIVEGIVTGLLVGMIQLFFGGYFLNIAQVFLDYIVSYAGIGLAGMFSASIKATPFSKKLIGLISLATLVSAFLRFIGNFLSGIIFYGSYAPKGTPVWIYSLTYNMSYIIPSAILTIVVMILLAKAMPKLFEK